MNVDKVESGAVTVVRRDEDAHFTMSFPGDAEMFSRGSDHAYVEYRALPVADFTALLAAARDGEKWRKERDEARALLKDARYVLWQAGLYKGYDVAGPLSTPVAQGLVARIDAALGADAGR